MPFFTVDDGPESPPGDDDEPFPDSWSIISAAGEARIDTGKVSRCIHARIVDACMRLGTRRFGLI